MSENIFESLNARLDALGEAIAEIQGQPIDLDALQQESRRRDAFMRSGDHWYDGKYVSDAEKAEYIKSRGNQQIPPDPAEVAASIDRLSAEYERLSYGDYESNYERMAQIQKELDGLLAQQGQIDQAKRSAFLQEKQPEIDALNHDINGIVSVIEQLAISGDPGDIVRAQELQGELDRRVQRRDDIRAGIDTIELKWQG